VVALEVKTGKVAWDQALTREKGFGLTGGPLVAKGKAPSLFSGLGIQGQDVVPAGHAAIGADHDHEW
jgi:hypothetical protein